MLLFYCCYSCFSHNANSPTRDKCLILSCAEKSCALCVVLFWLWPMSYWCDDSGQLRERVARLFLSSLCLAHKYPTAAVPQPKTHQDRFQISLCARKKRVSRKKRAKRSTMQLYKQHLCAICVLCPIEMNICRFNTTTALKLLFQVCAGKVQTGININNEGPVVLHAGSRTHIFSRRHFDVSQQENQR